MSYTKHKHKGSEIRIGKDRKGRYWATAWGGIIVEEGRTKSSALNNAKRKMNKQIARNKKHRR